MPCQADDLDERRSLITESGFGPHNRLTVARVGKSRPVRRERRDPLADPSIAPLIDPGDQMSVFEFEELEAAMAEGFGIVQDFNACEWRAPVRS